MITHRPSPTRLRALAAAALVLASLAACSSGGARPPSSPIGAGPSTPAAGSPSADPSAGPSSAPGAGAEGSGAGRADPTTVPAAPGVPELALAAAIADAASRAGVDASQVTIVSGEEKTWPDGSLGCPKMGFMYTQVVTPGYRLILEAGGKQYDYRGSLRGGEPALCENPVPGAAGGQG